MRLLAVKFVQETLAAVMSQFKQNKQILDTLLCFVYVNNKRSIGVSDWIKYQKIEISSIKVG